MACAPTNADKGKEEPCPIIGYCNGLRTHKPCPADLWKIHAETTPRERALVYMDYIRLVMPPRTEGDWWSVTLDNEPPSHRRNGCSCHNIKNDSCAGCYAYAKKALAFHETWSKASEKVKPFHRSPFSPLSEMETGLESLLPGWKTIEREAPGLMDIGRRLSVLESHVGYTYNDLVAVWCETRVPKVTMAEVKAMCEWQRNLALGDNFPRWVRNQDPRERIGRESQIAHYTKFLCENDKEFVSEASERKRREAILQEGTSGARLLHASLERDRHTPRTYAVRGNLDHYKPPVWWLEEEEKKKQPPVEDNNNNGKQEKAEKQQQQQPVGDKRGLGDEAAAAADKEVTQQQPNKRVKAAAAPEPEPELSTNDAEKTKQEQSAS
jgi:hypothetical protein